MCKYCEENFLIVDWGDSRVTISDKKMCVDDITEFGDLYNLTFEINFCPICGQELD